MRISTPNSLHTIRDLLHSLRNSLSLISGHSQYLLNTPSIDALCGRELRIIHRAAEKAASDLGLVPESFATLELGIDTLGMTELHIPEPPRRPSCSEGDVEEPAASASR
jgi:hypothetical protein